MHAGNVGLLFSGADLANLVNQAALRGSADGKDAVTMHDFDWARDKIIMGNGLYQSLYYEMNVTVCACVCTCMCVMQ